ncbi:undecaprenyl-diphosphate phosphatase [bacterium]|nr:undecaprenyl-diphosphate phosphatase [bacterium]
MPLLLIAIVLGLVQGLTEFLPVSSSGHLVIFQYLFKVEDIQLLLSVAVHFGTLLAVLVFFFNDWVSILSGFCKGVSQCRSNNSFKEVYRDNEQFRIGVLIILANIPAGLVGLTLKDYLEQTFSSISLTGCMLLVTALFLFLTRFMKKQTIERDTFSLGNALIIGLAQSVALLPGISRSGATISMALLLGIEREWAARFSFLLSIPAILGAFILELEDFSQLDQSSLVAVIAGTITAALVGYLALKILMKVVKKGVFYRFAYYCLIIGITALLIGLLS